MTFDSVIVLLWSVYFIFLHFCASQFKKYFVVIFFEFLLHSWFGYIVIMISSVGSDISRVTPLHPNRFLAAVWFWCLAEHRPHEILHPPVQNPFSSPCRYIVLNLFLLNVHIYSRSFHIRFFTVWRRCT